MWGYPVPVLGAISPFLEPSRGHLSPKVDKVYRNLTLRYPHEGPCVGWFQGANPARTELPACVPDVLRNLVSLKLLVKSFYKSRCPHKSVNLFFIFTDVKKKLTDLCGDQVSQKDFINVECEMNPVCARGAQARESPSGPAHRGDTRGKHACQQCF